MGQQQLSPALMVMGALGAFRNRVTGQQRLRAAGELRKSETHRSYPPNGERERERHLRHLAAGLVPADQLGQIVDGRVV